MRKNILIFGHNDATQFIDIFNQYTAIFDRARYEVTVVYLTGKPSAETRARTQAENVIFLDLPKAKIRMLKISAIKKMYQLCREKKFHLVICHRYKPTYIMLWVAQFLKIPALIFVMHEFNTMAGWNRRLLIALLRRKNMLFAGVSNAVRDDLRRDLFFIPSDSIITLYNAIDTQLIEPQFLSREQARAALKLAPHDFIFGNIARLAINKDQTSLIDAFAQIKPHYPHTKLIILGDGMLEATLKQQAISLGLENEIIFTGFIPLAYQYLTAFDCFILSSIQEAFGRVLIEAMLAKIPIIATRVNGIPEVVADKGILVPPKEVEILAQAMKKMLDTSLEERTKLAQQAYERVENYFSLPAFQKQLMEPALIKTILG